MDTERFRSVLPPDRYEQFERTAAEARELLDGRVVWNVNSTAQGGGVVELLRSIVPYGRGLGVDSRWLVIDGTPSSFTITKRIHNRLHGAEGDGGAARRRRAADLRERARPEHGSVGWAGAQRRPGHRPRPAAGGPDRLAARNRRRCHLALSRRARYP